MADRPETERTAMTDAPATTVAPVRSGAPGALAKRWPTALALLVSAPSFAGPQTPEGVHALAEAMLLLPLWYVLIAALARRSWTWFVLVGVIGLFVLLGMQDRVEPTVVLMAIGLVAVLWGAVRGRLVQPSFLLQVAGLVAFAALAVAGLLLVPDVGRYVVAAGWFAHGLWDLAHLRADSGVARSGAEWCAVVDVLIAVQLVVLPLAL
ncbi:MAG TPA: hypothetical protein VNP92_23105 [Actinophytocola sp.]|nr:hypothetical protein [Actinophytocola sp.]